jgi:hypothetical protein
MAQKKHTGWERKKARRIINRQIAQAEKNAKKK